LKCPSGEKRKKEGEENIAQAGKSSNGESFNGRVTGGEIPGKRRGHSHGWGSRSTTTKGEK